MTYYQNNENDRLQFPFQDMHNTVQNFQTNNGNNNSDFHLDTISVDCVANNIINMENVTESTTSSIDEKAVNKTEQFNGNNDAQLYYNSGGGDATDRSLGGIYDYEKAFDEEILFVCAEEVINSCEQNRDADGTTNDERVLMQSNAIAPEERSDTQKELAFRNEEPAKGRIYVVSNLMKTTNDIEEHDGDRQPGEVVAPEPNSEDQVEVIESNDEEDVQCVNNADSTKVVQVFLLDNAKKTSKRKKAIGRPKGGRNNRYTRKFWIRFGSVGPRNFQFFFQ